jgi:hypothetical protein
MNVPPPPGPRVARAPVVPPAIGTLLGNQFLREHLDLFTRLTKSELTTLTEDDKKQATKPFWFSYFWEETGPNRAAFSAQAALFVQFFELMYVLPPTWDPQNPACELRLNSGKLEYRPGIVQTPIQSLTLKPNAWGQIPDLLLLNVLQALLTIGFESVTPKGSDLAPFRKADFIDSSIQTSLALGSDNVIRRNSLVGEVDKAYFLGWRGDGRDVKKIQAAGGLINKAQSNHEGYAASQNMRAAWHPFSLPANQNQWFFRRAKSDNCLQSVVSVSTDFKTASTFPLLNGDYINLPAVMPTEQQAKNLDRDHQRKWYRISGTAGGGPKTVIRFVDRQQLYLVIIDTQYFDTQKKQTDKFPEIAVKQIPDSGVFACVAFIRVHHVTTENGGMTALLDAGRSVPPTLDGCRRYCQSQKFAKILYTHVQRIYSETIASLTSTFHVKWTPTGAAAVAGGFTDDQHRPMQIQTVKGILGEPIWP